MNQRKLVAPDPATLLRSPVSARLLAWQDSATVRIADSVATLRNRGVPVLDFSAGRPVEHTPDFIAQAAAKALLGGDTHQTMARGRPEYREACARKLLRDNGISADPESQVIATMGVKHGMLMALLATLDPGDEVIVEDPAFVSYEPLIRICGGVARPVPLFAKDGYRWKSHALRKAVGSRTRAILFCSPHNPAGTVHTVEDLATIADVARESDLTVIADETYERLVWGGRRHISIATLPGMMQRTISLYGLTKAFSMGGWRVGFACASEPIISAMVKLQQHLNTCVGSFAQTGAIAALRDGPHPAVSALWRDWEARCDFAADALAQVPGITCSRPEGGFYAWVSFADGRVSSRRVAEALLERYQMALVPGESFGAQGEGCLRLTCVRSWDDLREGIARLQKAIPELIHEESMK